MGIVLNNALLADLDPPRVESGGLRLERGTIVARGSTVKTNAGDDQVDCAGCVVLPGLVNGHAHLYSALALGMPPPPRTPGDFGQILEYVWWRLDRALDADSIETSGIIGGLDAAHCGTTTLIDHHASPECIADSLDALEAGVREVGLRAVLCYETTDRHGRAAAQAGITENRRYLKKTAERTDGWFAGLAGAHASFTLEEESLAQLGQLAEEFATGVHIHVAEDPCDEAHCRARYDVSLMERLARHGVLRPASIFAHGTHFDAEAVARANEVGVAIAHCPRSNMNNAVGYAPTGTFKCPVLLGTDGIGGDMLTEAKHAWFKACDGRAGLSPADIVGMLAASARRASQALGVTLGKLEVGAAADIVITDYLPPTPLTADNFAGHFIFGLGPQHVRDVIVNGSWLLRGREIRSCDEVEVRRRAESVAKDLWQRMIELPA